MEQEKNITVKKAAELLGKGEQFVRIGLQNKSLPFGVAVRKSDRWNYHISPALFYEYIGLKFDERKED